MVTKSLTFTVPRTRRFRRVRQGLRFRRQALPDILAKRTDVLSPRMARIVADLASDWRQLDGRIETVEKLRVDADQAPASGIQGPAIGGKRGVPSCEPICIDDLVRVLAGWLVAHIVVARQGHDARAQVPQRGGCEGDVGATWRSTSPQ